MRPPKQSQNPQIQRDPRRESLSRRPLSRLPCLLVSLTPPRPQESPSPLSVCRKTLETHHATVPNEPLSRRPSSRINHRRRTRFSSPTSPSSHYLRKPRKPLRSPGKQQHQQPLRPATPSPSSTSLPVILSATNETSKQNPRPLPTPTTKRSSPSLRRNPLSLPSDPKPKSPVPHPPANPLVVTTVSIETITKSKPEKHMEMS